MEKCICRFDPRRCKVRVSWTAGLRHRKLTRTGSGGLRLDKQCPSPSRLAVGESRRRMVFCTTPPYQSYPPTCFVVGFLSCFVDARTWGGPREPFSLSFPPFHLTTFPPLSIEFRLTGRGVAIPLYRSKIRLFFFSSFLVVGGKGPIGSSHPLMCAFSSHQITYSHEKIK